MVTMVSCIYVQCTRMPSTPRSKPWSGSGSMACKGGMVSTSSAAPCTLHGAVPLASYPTGTGIASQHSPVIISPSRRQMQMQVHRQIAPRQGAIYLSQNVIHIRIAHP